MLGYGWQNQGWGGGGWLAMIVMMILFWGFLIAAVIFIIRHFNQPHHITHTPVASDTAVETLKMRFAKGEMDEDEFLRRLRLLKGES